ncbi:DUF6474 family protein [Pseudonocardia bannensis]|uniref:DUF6474 family protein n=1 Tax=Pseudonocardia bannensis TaxID=630973 RepID=UPI001FEB19BB|nr:DUF6474 family protein [Pseudonocardia bannensis]
MGLRRGPRRAGRAGRGATATTDADTIAGAGTNGQPGRKAARKAAKAEKAARGPLTPARAKRAIGVGKAVAPLLAPYALAVAGLARSRWDEHRARKLGVSPDQLSTYSGRGGALHARISRAAEALVELDSADAHATGAARRFALDTRPRLADLAVAVRAAEQMPTPRRRTAYRAISGELDQIETALLIHLGIRT